MSFVTEDYNKRNINKGAYKHLNIKSSVSYISYILAVKNALCRVFCIFVIEDYNTLGPVETQADQSRFQFFIIEFTMFKGGLIKLHTSGVYNPIR